MYGKCDKALGPKPKPVHKASHSWRRRVWSKSTSSIACRARTRPLLFCRCDSLNARGVESGRGVVRSCSLCLR